MHNVYQLVKHTEMTKLQISFYFRVGILVSIILGTGHFLGCIWLMLGRYMYSPTRRNTRPFLTGITRSRIKPTAGWACHRRPCANKLNES